MALRNREEKAAAPAPAGKFENEDGASVATAERPTSVNTDVPVSDEVKAAATTALAQVGSRALTTGKLETALASLDSAIAPDQAESLMRVKSGSGNVKDADGFNYGEYVDLELVSFHTQWIASPGSDDDEAKELVRYSYDGKTRTDTGASMADYIAALQAQGYEDASIKQYTVLVGVLIGAAKPGGEVGNLVQVSLSPQSRKSFDSYRLQASVKQRMGKLSLDAPLHHVRITAESKSKGSRDFTLLKVTEIPA